MTDRWFAILNPTSGGGRALHDRPQIERELGRVGLRYEIGVSEYAGHAIELASEAAALGHCKFLAIGGDGTLNEILHGVLSSHALDANELTLGLLPVGRGNDWARGRGLPRHYGALADLLASGHVINHDVGVIEHPRTDRATLRYFLNVAGAGFDAHVVSKTQGNRFGVLTYLAALPAGFASWKSPLLSVSAEGQTRSGNVFVVFATIGRYCGGGMLVAPGAIADDGLLDVIVIGDISKWELVRNIRRLFDGSLLDYEKVWTCRTKTLEIAGPLPVGTEADGELLPPTPAKISVMSQRVRVISP